jgi:hypothetical protein
MTRGSTRAVLSEFVFWLHLVIISAWVALFFVPLSLWPGRIAFHFCFSMVVIAHQFIWGAIVMPWTKRYRMVCILTTLMQALRGYKISDPRNFTHSFVQELFHRAKVRVPAIVPTALTLGIVTGTTVLYCLFR